MQKTGLPSDRGDHAERQGTKRRQPPRTAQGSRQGTLFPNSFPARNQSRVGRRGPSAIAARGCNSGGSKRRSRRWRRPRRSQSGADEGRLGVDHNGGRIAHLCYCVPSRSICTKRCTIMCQSPDERSRRTTTLKIRPSCRQRHRTMDQDHHRNDQHRDRIPCRPPSRSKRQRRAIQGA